MKRDEPEVIDLAGRRKAMAEEAAKAKAAAAKTAKQRAAASRQGLLGGRRHAGLILLAVALVLLALYLGPMLF